MKNQVVTLPIKKIINIPDHQGNFGEVYLGKWNDKPVALKKLKNASQIPEFKKEVEVLM